MLNPDSGSRVSVSIPAPLVRIRRRLDESVRRGAFVESVVIQHVALESLGHAVLEKIDSELESVGNVFGRLRRLVLAQERRHHEFGARWVETAGDDGVIREIVWDLAQESERVVVEIAPLLTALGADVDNIIEALRASLAPSREAA